MVVFQVQSQTYLLKQEFSVNALAQDMWKSDSTLNPSLQYSIHIGPRIMITPVELVAETNASSTASTSVHDSVDGSFDGGLAVPKQAAIGSSGRLTSSVLRADQSGGRFSKSPSIGSMLTQTSQTATELQSGISVSLNEDDIQHQQHHRESTTANSVVEGLMKKIGGGGNSSDRLETGPKKSKSQQFFTSLSEKGSVQYLTNKTKAAMKPVKAKSLIQKRNNSSSANWLLSYHSQLDVSQQIFSNGSGTVAGGLGSGGDIYISFNIGCSFLTSQPSLSTSTQTQQQQRASVIAGIHMKVACLCHDSLSSNPRQMLLGYSTGEILFYNAFESLYIRFNRDGYLNRHPVHRVKWIGGGKYFLAAFGDGQIIQFSRNGRDYPIYLAAKKTSANSAASAAADSSASESDSETVGNASSVETVTPNADLSGSASSSNSPEKPAALLDPSSNAAANTQSHHMKIYKGPSKSGKYHPFETWAFQPPPRPRISVFEEGAALDENHQENSSSSSRVPNLSTQISSSHAAANSNNQISTGGGKAAVVVTDLDVSVHGVAAVTLSRGVVYLVQTRPSASGSNTGSSTFLALQYSYYGAYLCCRWSSDGQLLACGGQDDSITIYDRGLNAIARLEGHESWVTCIDFIAQPTQQQQQQLNDGSSGGSLYSLVSGGEDRRVCFWQFQYHQPPIMTKDTFCTADDYPYAHIKTISPIQIAVGVGQGVQGLSCLGQQGWICAYPQTDPQTW